MRRFLIPLILCLAALTAAGCKMRLEFNTSAPIQTPYRVTDGIIATFPDDLKDRIFKIRVGGFLDGKIYQIPVHDAYVSEITSRLTPMFTRGVSIIDQGVYDQITPMNVILPASRDESQERTLDEVMADIRKKEAKDKDAPKKSDQALTEEAFRAMDFESIQKKQHSYLLKFDNALLGVVDSRVRTSFRVHLIDRRTGNELMTNIYQGRSERFVAGQNDRTNEINLTQLVRQSLTGGMSHMLDDIAIATGASGSKL